MMADDDTPTDGPDETPDDEKKVTRLADRRNAHRARAKPVQASAEPHLVRLGKAQIVIGRDCPYEPLGHDGALVWVRQASGHVRGLTARDLSRNMIVMLCGGDTAWLGKKYPRFRNGKQVNGFAADMAVNDLIAVCNIMGFWQQDQHVRGLGAWLGDDGELVLHRGDHLIVRGHMVPLGRHGEYLYVPDRPLPVLPLRDDPDGTATAGAEILARLDTFQWQYGSFDAFLMFGWLCAAMIGGALRFRPHVWIPGELGVGKSTLQLLISTVLGRWGMVSVTDATPAGIWQSVNFRCVPIGCDEMEPSPDNHASAMVKFARQASSGGHIVRGSASHQSAEFMIQSCFCCSSIIVPPMPSQDISRFATLNLLPRDPGNARRPFDLDRLERWGAALTLRLSRQFDFLTRDVIPELRGRLMEAGFAERSADLYSALLGAAGVALYDTLADMRWDTLLLGHQMKRLMAQVADDLTAEWRRMMDYLLSTRTDRQRAESVTIGELLDVAARPMLMTRGVLMQRSLMGEEADLPDDDQGRASKARERLKSFGLRVAWRVEPEGARAPCLIVANSHRQLADLFAGSVWGTTADAAGGGGWAQVARRAPGAIAVKPTRFRDGVYARGTSVPLAAILPGAGTTPQGPDGEAGENAAAVSRAVH
jgi:hypothetical protein